MSARAQSSAVLHCHPDTPCTSVASINSLLRWGRGGVLTITYVLNGIVEHLRIPSYRSNLRVDGLWQHTCFEAFIGVKNDAEYYEFNLSPSGEWAAYGFRDYRDGKPMDVEGHEPRIAVQRDAKTLELSAVIHVDSLPGFGPDVYLWLGLSAVIEDLNGSLSYWALKHPSGKPDFHHADAFALEVAVAGEKL